MTRLRACNARRRMKKHYMMIEMDPSPPELAMYDVFEEERLTDQVTKRSWVTSFTIRDDAIEFCRKRLLGREAKNETI